MVTQFFTYSHADASDAIRSCALFAERSPFALIAVTGPSHIVHYVNPAFASLVESTVDRLVGRTFSEIMPESVRKDCAAAIDGVLQTGKPAKLSELAHQQSPPIYWSYSMWALPDANERTAAVMIQVNDCTEMAIFHRRATAMNEALLVSSMRQHELIDTIQKGEEDRHKLQQQLYQAQKLESLGVLAGGVAHDLNNLLTPVLGFAELASRSLIPDSPAFTMLEEVTKNARRAADLVQQILAYAGKGRFVIQPVDLTQLVQGMTGLLSSAVAVNAELVYDLLPVGAVEADATQLEQLILNLVINASEALEDKTGKITLRTRVTESAVLLEVSDTGCGISATDTEKIFDPFYSTKFTGRGLGLAVVQGIVRGHHGELQISSEPGHGSSFRVVIPCSTRETTEPGVPAVAESWRGTATVLVIDDDSGVRNIAAFILKQSGFTVLTAGDGQEGLEVFQANREQIGAVVLDLTMPRMDGLETITALNALQPDLPIVLMSGYSVTEITSQFAGRGIAGFVQKPFRTSDFLSAIRQALAR